MSELVEPKGVARHLGVLAGQRAEWPLHVPRAQHRLEPKFTDGVVELGHRLFGRMHGNGGHRRQAGRPRGECLGVAPIEGAACSPPVVVIGSVEEHQAETGVHDAEVDAHVVQPLVEELGKQRSGQIDGAGRRCAPPRTPRRPGVGPLLRGSGRATAHRSRRRVASGVAGRGGRGRGPSRSR